MPASTLLDERDAAHLLRHAGFGGTARDVSRLVGETRQDAVAKLLGKKPSKAKGPSGKGKDRQADLEKLQVWWLKRMMSRSRGVQEKLVLFWHDHFASPVGKNQLILLAEQNALFRQHGMDAFPELLQRVTRDRAMLLFLDGIKNRVVAPNENYARELMELFCLGSVDRNGLDNYTQADVVEMSRALTGYRWEGTGKNDGVFINPYVHDDGAKTLFQGKVFEASGELGAEREDGTPYPPETNIHHILLEHRDSDGRPTAARFLVTRLWEWFACPDPPLAVVDELADVFVASGYVVRELLTALFTHDHFYAEECRGAQVKTPIDFALQSLKALEVRSPLKKLPAILEEMGLSLFEPPGVEGWTHGPAWLATSRLLARFELAQAVCDGGDPKAWKFKPKKLFPKGAADTDEIVGFLLERLRIEVPASTRQILGLYLNGGTSLQDKAWLEKKFRGVFILLLTLPEFQVH